MGYPPPCQPPLVTAESSSPSFTPKSKFQIVDSLFPSCLLPGGRVSVNFPPKCSISRVVLISTSRRLCSSLPVVGFPHFHRSDRASFRRSRPFSMNFPKVIPRFGFGHGGPFPLARKRVARLPSVVSVSRLISRRLSVRFGFTEPFVATEVVPKNCYCYSSRRCTVVGTTATRSQPSLFHISRRSCG